MMIVTEWLCLAWMLQEELLVSPWDHCCGAVTSFLIFFACLLPGRGAGASVGLAAAAAATVDRLLNKI
jgi:hypothetical protein